MVILWVFLITLFSPCTVFFIGYFVYIQLLLIRMKTTQHPQPLYMKVNPKSKQKLRVLQVISDTHPTDINFPVQVQPICAICQKQLRKQTKIMADNTHYCVGCFATHLPHCQTYQVLSHESFDVFGGGWPARDEVIMLSAIERFGFGNWAEIQQYMAYLGANYFRDQIENHYDRFYGKQNEIISNFLVPADLTKITNPSKKSSSRVRQGGKFIEKSTCYSMSRLMEQKKEQIPCYNQKRKQFSIEYKQNLEKFIADLEFRENDSQKQRELKYKILEAYNLGLEDRIKKHDFIIEYRLLDQNCQAEETKCLQSNAYANRAHQLLIELMRTIPREEYLEIRKSLQFCLKIQAIIDRLRAIRSSNPISSLLAISKLDKCRSENVQELGKPRKRVHKNPEQTQEYQEKTILKKLGLTKDELSAAIFEAQNKNQTVFYNDIKITPINNLNK